MGTYSSAFKPPNRLGHNDRSVHPISYGGIYGRKIPRSAGNSADYGIYGIAAYYINFRHILHHILILFFEGYEHPHSPTYKAQPIDSGKIYYHIDK